MDSKSITGRFLEAVKFIMELKGISKAEVAKSIGITPQKLSNISDVSKEVKEDGKKPSTNYVKTEILGAFCRVYIEVSSEYILTNRGRLKALESEDTESLYDEIEECQSKLKNAYNEIERLRGENETLRRAFNSLRQG